MGISHFFIANTQDKFIFEFWNYWDLLALTLIPPMQLSYAIAFVGKEQILKKFQFVMLFYIPSAIFLNLLWTTNLIEVNDFYQAISTPWGYSIKAGEYLNFFTLYHLSYYFPAYLLMIRFYIITKDSLKKKQALLIIIALLIPTIGGVFFQGILPGFFGFTAFPAASPLVTVTNIIVTIAILKYSLTIFNPVLLSNLVFQTMKEGVLGISKLLEVEYLNLGAKKLLGYPDDWILGSHVNKFLKDMVSYNRFIDAIANWPSTETFIQIEEVKIATYGNKEILVTLSVSKIESENKVVLGYALVLSDITEIKQYASKLMRLTEGLESAVYERTKKYIAERDKLFFILSGINEAVIALDLQRRIVIFNKSSEKLFGLNASEALGKPVGTILKLSSGENTITEDIYAPISIPNYEGILFQKTGLKITSKNEFYANVISGKIKEGQNVGLGCILTFHDVTAEQRLEKTKVDFINAASHQLRTPLTVIIDYLSVFLKKNSNILNESQKDLLSVALSSAERLNALIDKLLYVSKIDAGNIILNKENFDWVEFIKNSLSVFKDIAIKKQIDLSIESKMTVQEVFADKSKMNEVLFNLLDNAIAHTPNNGKIKVFLEMIDGFIITHITDTGEGIPKDAIPHIFNKFLNVSSTLVADPVKTGVGLYITKSIIEMHNGKLWVESTVGKGSTFSFSLPLVI